MNFASVISLAGFHGTSRAGAGPIADSTYKISPSPEDWLGSGVYFFIDGIACPIRSASEWARNKFGRDDAALVKSTIRAPAEKVLDLRSIEGLARYDAARIAFLEQNRVPLLQRRDLNIKKRKDIRLDDRIVTEAVCEKLGIAVLIHNVYIKNALQRELIMESSYPNATVCSVRDVSFIEANEIVPLHPEFDTGTQLE